MGTGLRHVALLTAGLAVVGGCEAGDGGASGSEPETVRPRDVVLALPDGTELAATRYGKDADPLVLVIHGGPSLGRRYLERSLLPLSTDYEVLVYDQRGAGESSGGPPAETFGIDRLLADIDAVADQLDRRRFFLLGHSWGSSVALSYAARHPDRVLGLALISPVDPGSEFSERQAANLEARTTAADSVALAAAFGADAFVEGTREGVERLMRTMYRPWFGRPGHAERLRVGLDRRQVERSRAMGAILSEQGRSRNVGWDDVSSIEVPTLLIHGTADVVPIEISRRLAERMPRAEIVELEGTGHFPMLERPKAFVEAVHRFFDREVVS